MPGCKIGDLVVVVIRGINAGRFGIVKDKPKLKYRMENEYFWHGPFLPFDVVKTDSANSWIVDAKNEFIYEVPLFRIKAETKIGIFADSYLVPIRPGTLDNKEELEILRDTYKHLSPLEKELSVLEELTRL